MTTSADWCRCATISPSLDFMHIRADVSHMHTSLYRCLTSTLCIYPQHDQSVEALRQLVCVPSIQTALFCICNASIFSTVLSVESRQSVDSSAGARCRSPKGARTEVLGRNIRFLPLDKHQYYCYLCNVFGSASDRYPTTVFTAAKHTF